MLGVGLLRDRPRGLPGHAGRIEEMVGWGQWAAVDISMSPDPRGACRVSEMDRSEERTLGLPHDTPGGG